MQPRDELGECESETGILYVLKRAYFSMQNSWFLLTQIEFLFLSATQPHGRSRWGKGGGGGGTTSKLCRNVRTEKRIESHASPLLPPPWILPPPLPLNDLVNTITIQKLYIHFTFYSLQRNRTLPKTNLREQRVRTTRKQTKMQAKITRIRKPLWKKISMS